MSFNKNNLQRPGSVYIAAATETDPVTIHTINVDQKAAAYALHVTVRGFSADNTLASTNINDVVFNHNGTTLSQVTGTHIRSKSGNLNNGTGDNDTILSYTVNGNSIEINASYANTPRQEITWITDVEVQVLTEYIENGGFLNRGHADYGAFSGSVLVTAANDAATEITRTTTKPNTGYALTAKIYGYEHETQDNAYFYELANGYYNDNGTLAQIGVPQATAAIGGLPFGPTINVDGDEIVVRTASVDEAVTWRANLYFQTLQEYLSNSGYSS